ncbi:MAG: hypothetical protein LUO93_07255 [Methanomicrobiales archaeon]|nr:hypothetical protein [Methanomicrobiales archaeon]
MTIPGDRVLRVLIAVLVILFAVTAGPFLVCSIQQKMYQATLSSELRYTLTITTSSTLSAATLFIPLPTDSAGASPVSELIGTGNASMVFAGWQTSIFGANNESYLKLSTDLLPGPMVGTASTYNFTLIAPAPVLNTRDPVRYDYTLFPKQDLTAIRCEPIYVGEGAVCYRYQSLIFASYNTSPEARVEVRVALSGSNRWEILREYLNEYTDSTLVVLYGPVEGWHTAEGWMVISIGDDNPFWKERVEPKVRINLTAGVDTSMMRWHTFTPLP